MTNNRTIHRGIGKVVSGSEIITEARYNITETIPTNLALGEMHGTLMCDTSTMWKLKDLPKLTLQMESGLSVDFSLGGGTNGAMFINDPPYRS